MAHTTKRPAMPNGIPRQLLRYITEVQEDESTLRGVMIHNGRAVFESWRNGKSYEFVLNSTAWLKSGYDCILVARGQSLREPVIIGRGKTWPLGLLKAWKGKRGYVDATKVTKRYAGGAKLSAYRGMKRKKSVDDNNESDYEDPKDVQTRDRARPRRTQRLSTASALVDAPQLEETAASPAPHAEGAPHKSGEAGNTSHRMGGRMTAQIKTEYSDATDIDVVDLTEDDIDTSTINAPSYASALEPGSLSYDTKRQYPHFSGDSVAFIFRDGGNKAVRERRLHECDRTGKLFMQAKAARIINLKQEDALLSARINGKIEVLVANGDIEDFEILLHTIKSDRSWKNNGDRAACVVEIRAA